MDSAFRECGKVLIPRHPSIHPYKTGSGSTVSIPLSVDRALASCTPGPFGRVLELWDEAVALKGRTGVPEPKGISHLLVGVSSRGTSVREVETHWREEEKHRESNRLGVGSTRGRGISCRLRARTHLAHAGPSRLGDVQELSGQPVGAGAVERTGE